MSKHLQWFCFVVAMTLLLQRFLPSVLTKLAYAISVLIPAGLLALCLNVHVMKQLVVDPGMWYSFALYAVGHFSIFLSSLMAPARRWGWT